MSAEFAATKGKFWEMHDLLYENQDNLEFSDLLNYAKSLNLSFDELKIAIENETFSEKIQEDFMGGVRSGVNGTPTFFINGQRFNDSFEYENLLEAITKELTS